MRHRNLLLSLFALLTLLAGCGNHRGGNAQTEEQWEAQDCCPPVIYLQPLNGFTPAEAEEVKKHLRTFLDGLGNIAPDIDVEILPSKNLTDNMLNPARTRYRADKIVNSYKDSANSHVIIMGLLHEDISIPYKGKPDWGVLGFSYKGSNAGVASTFRLSREKKKDFWKVVAHEFVHAYFDYDHCPKDNDACIIQDAHGKANFSNKNTLCPYCKKNVWKSLEASIDRQRALR